MASIINSSTSSGVVITPDTSGVLQLQTANTTAVTIDGSQNVGIGNTTPVNGSNLTTLTVYNATQSALYLQNSSTGTTATDGLSIGMSGTDCYFNNRESGNIITYVNGSERMRITSSGQLLVGTTTATTLSGINWGTTIGGSSGNNFVVVNTTTAGQSTSGFQASNYTGGAANIINFYNGSGGYVAAIQIPTNASTGTTVSYGTGSDYRLKENVVPMTGALNTVSQLKPCTYTWKSNGLSGQGFIAHELQAVVPDCVVGEKDAVNEDGSIKPQMVDTSFLVATLTAAIQEQQAIITDLKARIETLEKK